MKRNKVTIEIEHSKDSSGTDRFRPFVFDEFEICIYRGVGGTDRERAIEEAKTWMRDVGLFPSVIRKAEIQDI